MAGEVTSTIESYLEAVFELQEIGERVTQARLARWFGVSPPATSEVVHRMERMGLIAFDSSRTIVFTDDGHRRAAEMAVRHRTIERYLVDVLGVPWHKADDEVRKMEPGVSDVVFERMRAMLGPVERCPHGNPIPGTKTAEMPIDDLVLLDTCNAGTRVRIDRIREDLELDLDMLRYLEDHDLLPGTVLDISDRDPEGAVTVVREGETVAVGPALASHMLCVPA
ncbi:MAG TPA: metal-dependent transcriptional regulator [Actinomycetota bacterium]|nr:metal-dependent transcriptional regulator [Actinomycetota bacterium]